MRAQSQVVGFISQELRAAAQGEKRRLSELARNSNGTPRDEAATTDRFKGPGNDDRDAIAPLLEWMEHPWA